MSPNPRKPWEPAAFPEKGDTHEDVTFAAVGRALSQWERLEVALAGLFAAFVGGKKQEEAIAMRAYGGVVASSARTVMINAAAETYFHLFPNPSLQKLVDELLSELRNYGARRNEIAHGMVMNYSVYTPPGRKPGTGCCLFPAHYNNKKIKIGIGAKGLTGHPNYIYSSVEIDAYGVAFTKLRPRVQRAFLGIAQRSTAPSPSQQPAQ